MKEENKGKQMQWKAVYTEPVFSLLCANFPLFFFSKQTRTRRTP